MIDITMAVQPTRRRREGPAADTAMARGFRDRYTPQARRYN